jgi:hypothetical protein
MLSQPWTTAHVDILPLYFPSLAERSDPKMYSESVRTLMVRSLRIIALPDCCTWSTCQVQQCSEKKKKPKHLTIWFLFFISAGALQKDTPYLD